MNVQIREALATDLGKYTDLLQKTYEFAYTDTKLGLTKDCFSKKVFSTRGSQSYLKSHLNNTSNQKTWLAFLDQKLIGAVTCIIKNDIEAELTGFYVLPQNQGQGIGKRLYDLALDFANNRDILLDIYLHNKKTIKMYKRWGWEIDKNRGNKGYFTRHWEEWPKELEAKCVYMILKRLKK